MIVVVAITIGAIIYLVSSTLFDDWGGKVIEDKENQILFANAYPSDGWNGATLELLRDNTFRYGTFGGSYDKGIFKIQNDTLLFDKELIGGFKAVLRYDTNSVIKDTFLIVLNSGNEMEKENRFRVHTGTNKTGINVPILKNK
jgi:hypothetical protein